MLVHISSNVRHRVIMSIWFMFDENAQIFYMHVNGSCNDNINRLLSFWHINHAMSTHLLLYPIYIAIDGQMLNTSMLTPHERQLDCNLHKFFHCSEEELQSFRFRMIFHCEFQFRLELFFAGKNHYDEPPYYRILPYFRIIENTNLNLVAVNHAPWFHIKINDLFTLQFV